MADVSDFLSFEQYMELVTSGTGPDLQAAHIELSVAGRQSVLKNPNRAAIEYNIWVRQYEDRTGALRPRVPVERTWFNSERHPAVWICVVAAGLALVSFLPMPYWYWPFLRIMISTASVLVGIIGARSGRPWWLVLAVLGPIVWAPMPFFNLDRAAWLALDVLVAAAFTVAAFTIPAPPAKTSADGKPYRYMEWWKIALMGAAAAIVYSAFAARGDYVAY